ncbi:MAG: DNA mismatch repair endonuclease MutL [Acidobacteriota bacterium]
MALIRLLPDSLVNKIAAGEVIERPASVVKELLENSLDAGASRITVDVEEGGRTRILVEDDGEGMDGDDLLMALERHATSKISSEGDLSAIATLGFRGEALPSIASVSRLTLSSRRPGAVQGASVRVEGGRYEDPSPAALAPGTRVEVRDLFFNVPARRKFLRSASTELSHVAGLLEHYALARPDVAFRLTADGRTLLSLAPAQDREGRFFELFPDLSPEDFARSDYQVPHVAVRGLAGRPEKNLGTPRYQFTLVNGRLVRDRVLQHAIAEAYADTMPRGRHPLLLLSVAVPFDRVDVNVHPAKREVRFADGQAVHGAVAAALRRAVAPGLAGTGTFSSASAGPPTVGEGRPPSWRDSSSQEPSAFLPLASSSGLPPAPLRALAQWRDSFIVCDGPDGLSVVDQHVAHERLRFEQFRRFIEHSGPRQAFLLPPAFTLPRHLAHRAAEMASLASAQGFEAEVLGEGVVAVRSAPAFLRPSEAQDLLQELFDGAGEALKTPRDRWKEILVMRSCRGSVMVGEPQPLPKLQYLLDALFDLKCPLTCPHGRPIVFTLKAAELLARFDRK